MQGIDARTQLRPYIRLCSCLERVPRTTASLLPPACRYQGHVSAALILGGFDFTGPHLYTIFPHGSTDTLPFASMGSGSLAAMAVLESGYKEEMTVR